MTPWMMEALTLALVMAGAVVLLLGVRALGAVVQLLPMSRAGQARARAWLPVVAAIVTVIFVAIALHWMLDQRGLGWTVPLLLIAV